jgi:hypothetical protein
MSLVTREPDAIPFGAKFTVQVRDRASPPWCGYETPYFWPGYMVRTGAGARYVRRDREPEFVSVEQLRAIACGAVFVVEGETPHWEKFVDGGEAVHCELCGDEVPAGEWLIDGLCSECRTSRDDPALAHLALAEDYPT